MLYHASETHALKTLYPHVSTHQKAYVYAIENFCTALLFGVHQDDFDFIISTDENGIPSVWECYPDALEKVYRGKGCSVYTVAKDGFHRGLTSWDAEWVSDKAVSVQQEIVVDDLYVRLMAEEQCGTLRVHRYTPSVLYKQKIEAHIRDRLLRFHIDLENCLKKEGRFSTYHKEIVESLLREQNING